MKDIQNSFDTRNINIDKVGIKDIKYPIILMDKNKGYQHTIASIDMFVRLPHQFKGTHMSRFIEILNNHRENINNDTITSMLVNMKSKLNSNSAHISLSFPYFIEKEAPVSKEKSLMGFSCKYIASDIDGTHDFITVVKVPVLSLCPCSKEISAFGAHNQRGMVVIKIRHKKMVWIEELVDIAETSSSAPTYSLLKRSDEKYITEFAYNNPTFVEDIVRNAAVKLNNDNGITWFYVSCENIESIHNHSAYAVVEKDKLAN